MRLHSNQKFHRLFARLLYRRRGATHWASGPEYYTYDPDCLLCRFLRLFKAEPK